jgi:hypothetical protein
MTRDFTEFLGAERVITPQQIEHIRGLVSKVREPIGSIAFSYGLLSGEDVDLILSEQRRAHRQFGEIAMAMGMLTHAQVDSLVRVQHVRSALEVAETLVLAGVAEPGLVFGALGRFLSQNTEIRGEQRAAA